MSTSKLIRLTLLISGLIVLIPGGVMAQDNSTNALSAGNNAFAFGFYQAIHGEEGNLFFSPYSISQALAMTYAGARNNTAEQMAGTLHFTLPPDQIFAGFKTLNESLSSENEMGEFRLNIANSIWGQQGFPFSQDYLDLLVNYYNGELYPADFVNAADEARERINAWAEEKTEGKIPKIIPEGALNEMTRLVLANAIYFNANWQSEFPEHVTQDGEFFLLDGSTVAVPLMSQENFYHYSFGNGYQAIKLPYIDGRTSMIVIVPEDLAAFEAEFNAETFATVLNLMSQDRVRLFFPRFEFEANVILNDFLISMGISDAFDPEVADFSGMVDPPEPGLFVSSALHKAYIKVDEEGTEAAAVTAMIMGTTSVPEPAEIDFRVDRPFIFMIYNEQADTILFMGRVLNPVE